jgi:predicted ATPase
MNKIEKESIRIKKLGALEDVYLPEILPVTVLIGESASGKSTFRAWFCL